MNEVDFILQHGEVPMNEVRHYVAGYDPQKAREYYLRTRELKGRQAGSKDTSAGSRPAPKVNLMSTPTGAKTSSAPKPKSSALEKRKATEKRIEEMKGRLEKLRKLLRELVKQAQARSGADPKDSKTKAAAGSHKLTAKERKEAAKRQEEYRKKNPEKKETLTEQEKRLAKQIEDVNAKIADARNDLKSAIAKARKGSANNRPAA